MVKTSDAVCFVTSSSVLADCFQVTSGRSAKFIPPATDSTYGQQGNAKTPKPGRSLYGKRCAIRDIRATGLCATHTGVIGSRTMASAATANHASICLRRLITPGMMNRAIKNTASSARTAVTYASEFIDVTKMMTNNHQSRQRYI